MKFLIHSNAPHVSTGYGVQCAHLVEKLVDEGHEVAVSCTYGQQGGMGIWRPSNPRHPENWRTGVRLYPVGYEVNGNDVIHNHAMHFFGGDPLAGWIITLLDVWCLINPRIADFNVIAWTPVDHLPAPPDVLKFFHRTDAVPVAMASFGERQLQDAGLDPAYVPLSVDSRTYKPTPTVTIGGNTVSGRQMLGVPEDAFVVGMVAMNKGWNRDRKGFNEAFRAFGQFWRNHQDAVLYVHSDWPGAAEGFNLKELATHASIPEHAIVFPESYAYFPFGFLPSQMAATYTAFDVLLAPSHGEGFCVPLIEAQACGTPVIASNFSTQTELTGAGWLVSGQLEWDQAQHASYLVPYTADIVDKLEQAYTADRVDLAAKAIDFAAAYDTDVVFETAWKPFLETLDTEAEVLPLDRSDPFEVAVIVPAMRPDNLERLTSSFASTNDGNARLILVQDEFHDVEAVAVDFIATGKSHTTYAEKVNIGLWRTSQPWILLVGDDVEFHPGWIEAARALSDRYDVIGTNDTTGQVKNPEVASGAHADHFFVRRSYIDTYGACLDGPGVLAPEVYGHWWVDKEIIELAKARGVFAPCLDAVIEHHHPGYDGREDLRAEDPTYMRATETAEDDRKTWMSRVPLIEMQRTTRGRR